MKPCYLNASSDMHVTLDGPALCVTQSAHARRLLPIVRISRLIVSGPVEFTTASLLICADRGITITFLGSDGRLRACLFGDSMRRTDLCQRLRDFLDIPRWKEHYEDWLRAMESRMHRRSCRHLGMAPEFTSFKWLDARIEELQDCWLGDAQRARATSRLAGLAGALAAECLCDAGLSAAHLRSLDPCLRLPYHLARWLTLDLRTVVIDWGISRQNEALATDHDIVKLFESRALRLSTLASAILNRLQRFLMRF